MAEHHKRDAGQLYERFFGLLVLGNTKDGGQTRADEKGPLGPSASVVKKVVHGHVKLALVYDFWYIMRSHTLLKIIQRYGGIHEEIQNLAMLGYIIAGRTHTRGWGFSYRRYGNVRVFSKTFTDVLL